MVLACTQCDPGLPIVAGAYLGPIPTPLAGKIRNTRFNIAVGLSEKPCQSFPIGNLVASDDPALRLKSDRSATEMSSTRWPGTASLAGCLQQQRSPFELPTRLSLSGRLLAQVQAVARLRIPLNLGISQVWIGSCPRNHRFRIVIPSQIYRFWLLRHQRRVPAVDQSWTSAQTKD
jgi:hypothetical protein